MKKPGLGFRTVSGQASLFLRSSFPSCYNLEGPAGAGQQACPIPEPHRVLHPTLDKSLFLMWCFLISNTALTILTGTSYGAATLGEASEPSGHKNGKYTASGVASWAAGGYVSTPACRRLRGGMAVEAARLPTASQ